MPNLKNYTTWLQYRCKFATVWTNVVKNLLFYILFSLSSLFIFSFLFSLTLRFPLSSPCIGSLSLQRWSFRDWHVSRTKLRRRFRFPSSTSSMKHRNDKRLRFGLQSRRSPTWLNSPSTGHARSHPCSSHTRSCRSHLEAAIDPLPSPLCPPFTLPFSGCGFFFYCNLGWSDGGGGLWAMGGDSGSDGGLWGWWPVVAVGVFFFFSCNLGWFDGDGGGGLWAMGDDSGSGGGLWGDGRWWLSVSLMIMGWDNILF